MKKWTYLVVAGLLAGATPMLQSCVDNDEPEGINVLRKAKAELIAAKKVVQEAEAARLKAEAAKLEAEAELIKAQAAIAKAQAEWQNAQTEADRARWEQEIAYARAEMEHQQKLWETAEKEAEVAYQRALAQLALVKAQVNAEQQRVLQAYIDDIQIKKGVYETAMKNVRKAQLDLLKATETLNEKEANKEYYTYEAQKSVAQAEKNLALAQEHLAAVEAEYELALTFDDEAAKARYEELYKRLVELIAELKKLDVAYAEKEAEMAPEYDELAQLQTAAGELYTAEIAIDEFKYEFPHYIVSNYEGEVTVVREGTYSLSNDTWLRYNLNRIERAMSAIKDAARDENQNAWTAESLAETKAMHKNQEAYVKGLKAAWQDAVNAYRTGTEYGTIANLKGDAEAGIAGYDDLVAAIEAYNDLVEPYLTAKAAFDNLLDETNNWNTYQTYEAQRQEARDEYDNLVNTLNQEIWDADNSYWNSYNVLDYEYQALYARWNELNIEVTQKGSSATAEEIQAVADAKTAYETKMTEINTARINYWGYWDNAANQHVDGTRDKAVAANNNKKALAEATRERKIAELDLAQEKKFQENNAAYAAQYETLFNAMNAAAIAKDDAYNAAQNIYGSLTDRVTNYSYWNSALWNAWANNEEFEVTDELAQVNKNDVENQVRNLSIDLYGSTGWNEFDDDRLVELTKADIEAKLAEEYGYEPWEILWAYTWYGAYGWELYYEAEIARAEALLGVTDAQLETMTADLQNVKEALEADYEAAAAAWAEATEVADAKEAEIEAEFEAIAEQYIAVASEYQIVRDLYDVYDSYVMGNENIISGVAMIVESRKEYVADREHDLQTAQMTLEAWNKNEIDQVAIAQQKLDEAQIAADIAKENLDAAEERLQKALEYMAVNAE